MAEFETTSNGKTTTTATESEVNVSNVRVGKEPLTYERGNGQSYFRDLAIRTTDGNAETRLFHHAQEMRAVAKEIRRRPDEVEYRVNPNTTAGQGGYFSPP